MPGRRWEETEQIEAMKTFLSSGLNVPQSGLKNITITDRRQDADLRHAFVIRRERETLTTVYVMRSFWDDCETEDQMLMRLIELKAKTAVVEAMLNRTPLFIWTDHLDTGPL